MDNPWLVGDAPTEAQPAAFVWLCYPHHPDRLRMYAPGGDDTGETTDSGGDGS